MTGAAEQVWNMAVSHAAAWSAGDAGTTGDLFAPDGEISVNGAPPHIGRGAIIETARTLMQTFPGLTVEANETRCAGSRAVFVWTLRGRHHETGRDVVLPGWHEWEMDDEGRVQRCRGFFDADDLQRQIAGD